MILSLEGLRLFYKLFEDLLLFVNKMHKVNPEIKSLDDFHLTPKEDTLPIRNMLYENSDIINDFIKQNLKSYSSTEIDIIKSWRNYKRGNFFIERHLKKHSIFIGDENKVYGVVGLYDPIEELIPSNILPFSVETVLLPFKDMIIYDSFFLSYNISFGSGYKKSLRNAYIYAKDSNLIITNLNEKKQKSLKVKNNYLQDIHAIQKRCSELKIKSSDPSSWRLSKNIITESLKLAEHVMSDNIDWEKTFKQLDKLVNKIESLDDKLSYQCEVETLEEDYE